MMRPPKEPTSDQCSAGEMLDEDDQYRYFAIWYPQMGGYVSRAVVAVFKTPSDEDSCFDVWVWHDGEFPFSDRNPAELHHCSPGQFMRFGEKVRMMQRKI